MADINEALRESEERYRTLFEQAPVGVFLYDRDLKLTGCNVRFTQILHSTPGKIIGLDLHLLREHAVAVAIERSLLGEVTSFEGRYQATTSEAIVWLSMRLAPLRDAEGTVIGGMGVVEDITEHRQAIEALRESEQRLALHVKRSPLGVIVWNDRFEVVEWNESASRIFGYTEREALGQREPGFIVAESSYPEILPIWEGLIRRAGGERSRNQNIRKDGRFILCDWYNTTLVDAAGAVIGVASLVEDVTDREASEEALKRSEARFRALIERAPDAVGVMRAGRLIYANPRFVSSLGYERPGELIGRQVRDFIHETDRPRFEQRKGDIERGSVLQPQEYRLLRRDGSAWHAEFVSMSIEYDGAPAVLTIARDLTERKQLQAHLLQAERMAAVGTLAAGVAHEINTPLAYVLTQLAVATGEALPELSRRIAELERNAGSTSDEPKALVHELSRVIESAREAAERIRNIVQDLKAYSRPDDGKLSPIDVRRVLDTAVNMVFGEIRHRARLVKHYDDVPHVDGNETRLGQVFVNLLVNAAQAIPEGEAHKHTIRLRTRVDELNRVVVEVADSGVGIPDAIKSKLFDPFFTTKPAGVGTGLGLWICHGIVTRMGGSIEFDSRPGSTLFRVLLPSAATMPKSSQKRSITPGTRRGRVLIIDDEAPLANALKMFLSDEHDVTVSTSGRDALALLAKDKTFDAILCDLMMPDITGVDVYEELSERAPDMVTRMVFVTGGAFTPRMRGFVERVSNLQLEKPFDLPKLRVLLRQMVGANEAS